MFFFYNFACMFGGFSPWTAADSTADEKEIITQERQRGFNEISC